MSKIVSRPFRKKFDVKKCRTVWNRVPIPGNIYEKKMKMVSQILLQNYFRVLTEEVKPSSREKIVGKKQTILCPQKEDPWS